MPFLSKRSAFTKSALSLLSLAAASVVPTTLAESPLILDLSQDFPIGNIYNTDAAAFEKNMTRDIRRFLVIEDGEIVMDYQRNTVNDDDIYEIWSATKATMAAIVGTILDSDEYDLSIDDTLGEIFIGDTAWRSIDDPDELAFKQNITIFELMTMTSGLYQTLSPTEILKPNPLKPIDMTNSAGINFQESLAVPLWNATLEFFYLSTSNILSYVILEVTGMTPREYAALDFFPSLGIDNDKIYWDQNFGGVEASFSGLAMTTKDMAKIAQLFLQKGKSAPDKQLVSEEFVDEALSRHTGGKYNESFGYLWRFFEFRTSVYTEDPVVFPNSIGEGFWCGYGRQGQFFGFNYESKRVVAYQRSNTLYNEENEKLIWELAMAAFDADLTWNVTAEPVESGALSLSMPGTLIITAALSFLAYWL